MKLDYFVYYRIAAQRNHAEAREVVEALLAHVATTTGVRGTLMMRRDDAHTWLEHYRGVSDHEAFEQALEAAQQQVNIASWLEASTVRHVERFIPCA